MSVKFWIGRGCIRIEKVDYKYGDVIPIDKLSKERLAELEEKGKIGNMPMPSKPEKVAELSNKNKKFESENSDLKNQVKELSNKVIKLEIENAEIKKIKPNKKAKAHIEELEATIVSLKGYIDEIETVNTGLVAENAELKVAKEAE